MGADTPSLNSRVARTLFSVASNMLICALDDVCANVGNTCLVTLSLFLWVNTLLTAVSNMFIVCTSDEVRANVHACTCLFPLFVRTCSISHISNSTTSCLCVRQFRLSLIHIVFVVFLDLYYSFYVFVFAVVMFAYLPDTGCSFRFCFLWNSFMNEIPTHIFA